jgi:hypothetical protein
VNEINMQARRNRNASFPSSDPVIGGPGSEPRWSLRTGEAFSEHSDLTDRMISATVNYDAQGNSSMTVRLTGRMAGIDGFFMVLNAGYGDETDRLFRGEVTNVQDSPNGWSEVTVGGTQVLKGRQRANMGLDFSGLNLKQAMVYINEHSAEFGGWEVIGGEEWEVHDPSAAPEFDPSATTSQPGFGVFGSEATWAEIESTLLDGTPYVSYDNPQGHITHRRPELRHGGDPVNYQWWWRPNVAPSAYTKDGFKFTSGMAQLYDRVIVFRRIQDYGDFVTEDRGPGKPKRVREFYGVYSEAQINRTGLHRARKNSDLYVPDFNGKQAQAEREASRLAKEHATVKGKFELSGPLRTWWPYDVIYVEQVEERPDPRVAYVTGVPLPAGDSTHVRALYTCLANGSITQNIGRGQFNASVSGDAALHSMAAVPSPAVASYRSTGLVPVAA